jgi:hypothetical protein
MTRTPRLAAVLLFAVCVLAACGESDQYIAPIGAADPTASPSQAAANPPPTGVAPYRPGAVSPYPMRPPGAPGQSGLGYRPDPDLGAVGDLSRSLLRPGPYGGTMVEIDSAGSAAPDKVTHDYLIQLVKQTTVKGVTETGSHTFAGKGNGGCWKPQEIVDMTKREAKTHTAGTTAAVRFFFLDGTVCQGSGVLGMAYLAGSVAIFTGQVNSLATPTVPADTFMKAVTTHEFGHILGLVNLSYKSATNHEDAQHPHHSSNKASVMYWAIDQSNLIQQFLSGPPTTYDSDDQADLQGLRDGTY